MPGFQARVYSVNLYTQLLIVRLHETSWRQSERTPLLFIEETQTSPHPASTLHTAAHNSGVFVWRKHGNMPIYVDGCALLAEENG